MGKDGGPLARLPEDIEYFGKTTSGRTTVMGHGILESFPGGGPLKNRVNVVLSRSKPYSPEDVQMYRRAEDVLEAPRDCNEDGASIIGRGMIYREFLPCCSKTYVTYIHRTFEVDTDSENLDQDENRKLEPVNGGREHKGISSEFRVHRGVR